MDQNIVKNVSIIKEILSLIEKSFKNRTNKSFYSFEQIHKMTSDIFNLTVASEKGQKEISILVIKRVIPLVDLLLKIDSNAKRNYDYLMWLKEYYRIAARTSLIHYMIYREWDEKDKFFEPRYHTLKGYIYFLEKLETDPNFHTLIFNAPSGYGKSFPAKVSEAWAFGQDPTGAMLSLCSNEDVVKAGSVTVMDEMQSQHFGEVFPNLKYEEDDKNYFLKKTESIWKLKDCKLPNSYVAKTTSSNVVGVRASKRIHIDDLYPNHTEALNQNTNQKFYNDFLMVWYKRYVQHLTPKVLITGTLWATGDFIDLIISLYKKRHQFFPHPKFPYVLISRDNSTAIIQIPALDYDTGESTMPNVRTTRAIMEEKDSMEEYLFETNFQQRPTDPESLFFSYNKLRKYESYPVCDSNSCYSVIDANRKSGKDNFSMPIFGKLKEDDLDIYPLKDVIFTKVATKDLYEEIIEKIIKHRIVTLVIESNVAPELASNLEKLLKAKNITYCNIIEKYTTGNKKIRIEDQKGNIIKRHIYPDKRLYPQNSEMAKFMNNLTLYNNAGSNPTDDAPDSIALFDQEIIEENAKPQDAVPMKRLF